MIRTFRFQLAVRFSAMMAAALGLISLFGWNAARRALDREINAALMNVASVQAGVVAADSGGRMALHEWELTPTEAIAVRDLDRFTQVWTADGRPLLRSRQVSSDLPLDTAALRAASAGSMAWSERPYAGRPIRSLFYPLGRLGEAHEQHVLQVAAPLDPRDRQLRTAAIFLAALVCCAVAGTFLGGWWLAGRAIRPVDAIIDRAQTIRPGVPGRIEIYANAREYERLVQVLNSMLERLEAAYQAEHRFTADASHELRSPLTALRGELELARRRGRSPEEYRRVIDSALEEVERLTRIAEDLLMLARSDAGALEARLQNADLVSVVERVLDRLRPEAAARSVGLSLSGPDSASARLDPDLFARVVWNLAENALKFTPSGGQVRVEVTDVADGPTLWVRDSGPGIDAQHLPHLFERFYRGDATRTPGGHGTGLGLSIARALVELHQGSIKVESRPTGTTFRVVLPPPA